MPQVTRGCSLAASWRRAFEAIYPLKINEVRITDGEITYVDRGPFKPPERRRVNIRAENIRNVRSREREYPWAFHANAVVFEAGSLVIDGKADFLAEPHLGITAHVGLEGIALDYFRPSPTATTSPFAGGRWPPPAWSSTPRRSRPSTWSTPPSGACTSTTATSRGTPPTNSAPVPEEQRRR